MNLRLLQGITAPYKGLQESLAIMAFRKKERIELLKTIAIVTATVNPEKAQQATQRLVEEMFPEHLIERAHAVERALELMEQERHRVYVVAPTGETNRRGGTRSRGGSILGKKRRPSR